MKIGFKAQAKSVVGHAAGITGIYTRNFGSKMTIVAFHRVRGDIPEDGLTCGAAKFKEFCQFFRRYFRVVPLSEQVANYRSGVNMGGTLSITFDDGYLDNFEVAAPILRDLGLPATFFVATGFIGTSIRAAWDEALPVHPNWMQWDHLRILAGEGFDIGCHTDGHIDLGAASPETVRTDIELSKQKLQDRVGVEARLFAYPFGGREHMCDTSRKVIQEAGFDCCASCYGGANTPTEDPFYLRRVPISSWFITPNQFGFELATDRT